MADRTLVSRPRNIGEIFFSGSQDVKKGDEVTWILDDTWAFKATEDCAVSTNASPFVNIRAGDVFLIYKRTQEDIDAGNSKGIYVFDRDTVVALAYPQEYTQDIVIENDIYNNNMNTIIVEADKTPTARISVSNSKPTVGTAITIDGRSSYAVSPATIVSYKWVINGADYGSSEYFSFTPSAVQQYDISLTVTDSDGRKNNTVYYINAQEAPTYPDVSFSETWKYSFGLIDASWREILSKTSVISGTGTVSLSVSVNFWVASNDNDKYGEVRILVDGVQMAYGRVFIPKKTNQNYTAVAVSEYAGTITAATNIKVEVRDQAGAPTDTITGGGSSQPSNQLQVSIKNRTS